MFKINITKMLKDVLAAKEKNGIAERIKLTRLSVITTF